VSVAERLRARTPTRRWVGLGVATALWFALYEVNLPVWDWLVYDLVGLDSGSRLGSGVHFFFYDSIKIILLLVGIIFAITVLRVVTPFCSCSAVPAFIGFVAAGVPLGVTLSFLIASPLVNEVAIALLFGMFGIGPTALYVGAGLVIAIVAGYALGRLRLERWVEPFVFETRLGGQVIDSTFGLTWDDRIQMGIEEVATILRKIWPYLLVGIGLGAAIHGWAPEDFFTRYAGASNPFAVLIAVAIGIPLYSNAAGIMPLVQALHDKGLPMGTLLAFMMAVVALSLPEMILLRRVLKPQLIAAFIAVTGVGIIAVGYLFNAVLPV
jgi:uncharacterized membrane protein YraQ (UPF0718 family)